jgi:hypothetical protein
MTNHTPPARLRINWPATIMVVSAIAVGVFAAVMIGLGHPLNGVG